MSLIGKLLGADIDDLNEAVPPEAWIGAAGIDRLGVDDGRTDDQADRDRELGDDQDVAQPAGTAAVGCAFVCLEH